MPESTNSLSVRSKTMSEQDVNAAQMNLHGIKSTGHNNASDLD